MTKMFPIIEKSYCKLSIEIDGSHLMKIHTLPSDFNGERDNSISLFGLLVNVGMLETTQDNFDHYAEIFCW